MLLGRSEDRIELSLGRCECLCRWVEFESLEPPPGSSMHGSDGSGSTMRIDRAKSDEDIRRFGHHVCNSFVAERRVPRRRLRRPGQDHRLPIQLPVVIGYLPGGHDFERTTEVIG